MISLPDVLEVLIPFLAFLVTVYLGWVAIHQNEQTETITTAQFKELVESYFKPAIQNYGFKGDEWVYSKASGGLTYNIQFVPLRDDGWIFIDLSVDNGNTLGFRGQKMELNFQITLNPGGWRYKKTESANRRLIAEMLKRVTGKGFQFFYGFSNYPQTFLEITLSDIRELNKINKTYQLTLSEVGWVLQLIPLHEKEGNSDAVRKLIEYGKKELTGKSRDWITDYLDAKERDLITQSDQQQSGH